MKKLFIIIAAIVLISPTTAHAKEEKISVNESFFSSAVGEYFRMLSSFGDETFVASYDKDKNILSVTMFASIGLKKETESGKKKLADFIYNIVSDEIGYDGEMIVTLSGKDKGQYKYSYGKTKTDATKASSEPPKYNYTKSKGDDNALKQAESLLEYGSYSRNRLRDSLVSTWKYTWEEADYALSNITVDWKEQAVKQAESLMEYGSYSRARLLESLQNTWKFTKDEAEYAVKKVYDEE